MPITIDKMIKLSVNDIENGKHDFGPKLKGADLLTGTPTMVDVDSTGTINITNVGRNASSYTDEDTGATVEIDEAVEYTVEPTAAGIYTLQIGVATVGGENYVRNLIVEAI